MSWMSAAVSHNLANRRENIKKRAMIKGVFTLVVHSFGPGLKRTMIVCLAFTLNFNTEPKDTKQKAKE